MTSFKPMAFGALVAAAMLAPGHAVAQVQPTKAGARAAAVEPVTSTAAPSSRADRARSTMQVVVRLTDKPLALMVGPNAKRLGSTMTIDQRRAYMASLNAKQDAVAAQVKALGGVETARVGKVHNAVVFTVQASTLPQIQRIPGVSSVRPVGTYQLSLAETVPYIGAQAAQIAGLTGAGVTIAVLDSGIDYTHKNLGGLGTTAAYNAAIANPAVIPAGLFPTAKVVGGYDFVGSTWTPTSGTRTEDPNPIDEPPAGGHGTHVADIIAGASLDGTHKGVAPGAKLYAVKVCSNQSSSCNGVALLKGMDWIIDPNGDLDFSDAADIVNLSLGSSYGQREDDLSEAVGVAVRFGIVAVVSAGNSADRPYILGSPSSTPEAISVAQTQVPSATTFALKIDAPAAIAGVYGNTATVDWAPIGAGFSGEVKTPTQGGAANNLACAALPAGSLTGKVALIDRGTCSVSLKTDNAAKAGAKGVLIGLVAAGDAISFSFGGGDTFVPTLVIQRSLANAIKANLAAPVMVTINASTAVNLVGSMASTSSRGPNYSYSAIKPEIGAPGASISAEFGTATGMTAFGGTSGAAPMVSGSAALLLQKFPLATPPEIKARLMNAANSTVYTNPATLPGVLAPITRIGAGEVRVNKAAAINTLLWDAASPYSTGLSFGTLRATGVTTVSKKVAVRNLGTTPRFYMIGKSFRYADDAASGAVTLSAPTSITVPAGGTGSFTLTMQIDASKLPNWNLGFAGDQGNGSLLQGVEFDGYISLNDAAGSVSLPWHVLPHKAAGVEVASTTVSAATGLQVANVGGATTGYTEAFALTGTSPQISTVLPAPGQNDTLIDLKAVGVRQIDLGGIPGVQFAITTYGQRAHPSYPAEFDVYVDSNGDGIDDYVVYTAEQGTFASTGVTLVYVQKLNPDGSANGSAVARFFADADLSSSNIILTVRASDIGITDPANQQFKFAVYAFDNYFGGFKDLIGTMTHTLGKPKFQLALDSFAVDPGLGGVLAIGTVTGGATASPSQSGILLLHYDGRTGRESDQITVTP
jgi:minor extracellular serine protease Vpr